MGFPPLQLEKAVSFKAGQIILCRSTSTNLVPKGGKEGRGNVSRLSLVIDFVNYIYCKSTAQGKKKERKDIYQMRLCS
jgi:hypothetical protein